jgi:hypothetical protein
VANAAGVVLLDAGRKHPAQPRFKTALSRYYRARTGRDPVKAFKGLDVKAEAFGKPARDLLAWVRKDARLDGDEGLLDYDVVRVVGRFYPGNLATRAAWSLATLEGPLETDGNNDGPIIRELQRTGDLPPGEWPWCAVTAYAGLLAAGWKYASAFRAAASEAWVEAWDQAAREGRFGLSVTSPQVAAQTPAQRSVLILFRFDYGSVEDHIGMTMGFPDVQRWTVPTVEGNTSSGVFGSQADGGGLWRRTRSLGSSASPNVGTTLIAVAG